MYAQHPQYPNPWSKLMACAVFIPPFGSILVDGLDALVV
jgi:hypothetical protein